MDDTKRPEWLNIVTPTTFKLVEPTGIAVYGDKLLVADHTTNEILLICEDGSLEARSTVVSDIGPLKAPHGLITLEKSILVADTLNDRVVELDLKLRTIGFSNLLAGKQLRRPHGLVTNVPGEYFLTDTDNHRIVRVQGSEATEYSQVYGTKPLCYPCGIGVSPSHLFVADTFNHRIVILEKDGKIVRVYGQKGRGIGSFQYPVAISSWQEWFVVADEFNQRLQLWRTDEEGDYFTACCISSNLCSPWLGKPFGVAFNSNGRLYVADRLKAQIMVVDFVSMLNEFSVEYT